MNCGYYWHGFMGLSLDITSRLLDESVLFAPLQSLEIIDLLIIADILDIGGYKLGHHRLKYDKMKEDPTIQSQGS